MRLIDVLVANTAFWLRAEALAGTAVGWQATAAESIAAPGPITWHGASDGLEWGSGRHAVRADISDHGRHA